MTTTNQPEPLTTVARGGGQITGIDNNEFTRLTERVARASMAVDLNADPDTLGAAIGNWSDRFNDLIAAIHENSDDDSLMDLLPILVPAPLDGFRWVGHDAQALHHSADQELLPWTCNHHDLVMRWADINGDSRFVPISRHQGRNGDHIINPDEAF